MQSIAFSPQSWSKCLNRPFLPLFALAYVTRELAKEKGEARLDLAFLAQTTLTVDPGAQGRETSPLIAITYCLALASNPTL